MVIDPVKVILKEQSDFKSTQIPFMFHQALILILPAHGLILFPVGWILSCLTQVIKY